MARREIFNIENRAAWQVSLKAFFIQTLPESFFTMGGQYHLPMKKSGSALAVLKIPIARSPEATCFSTGRSIPRGR